MKLQYVAIHPDEDGHCVTFLNEKKLQELLDGEYMGDNLNFLSKEDLKQKGVDPQYWNDRDTVLDILLLKIEKVVIPKPTVIKWRIN